MYKNMVSAITGETLEKAMKELGEVPEKREEVIEEFRTKLKSWEGDPNDPHEKGLTLHRIEDDMFLLRFLRARKFDVERSTKLFVNYYKYRTKYKSMLGELTPKGAESTLKEKIVSVLPHCTKDGCKIIVARLGAFNLDEYPPEAILRMMLVILDHLIEDEETQVHGIVFCEDLSALTFYRMMTLIRKEQISKGMMLELLQDSFPARFKAFHIINQPWYISVFMTVVRPFMKQKTKDRMHMHGGDFSSLHEYIAPECLPVEFGGELETLDAYSAECLFQNS